MRETNSSSQNESLARFGSLLDVIAEEQTKKIPYSGFVGRGIGFLMTFRERWNAARSRRSLAEKDAAREGLIFEGNRSVVWDRGAAFYTTLKRGKPDG